MRLSEVIHVKCLAWCLAHSQHWVLTWLWRRVAWALSTWVFGCLTPCGVSEVYGLWESDVPWLTCTFEQSWGEWNEGSPPAQVVVEVVASEILVWVWQIVLQNRDGQQQKEITPTDSLFSPPSSSYGSHYFECFLVGWEMLELICFDWKMNFSYWVFQRIFFFFFLGMVANGASSNPKMPLGSKVPLLFFFWTQSGRNLWNKWQGAERGGEGFLWPVLTQWTPLTWAFSITCLPVIV